MGLELPLSTGDSSADPLECTLYTCVQFCLSVCASEFISWRFQYKLVTHGSLFFSQDKAFVIYFNTAKGQRVIASKLSEAEKVSYS